MFDDLTRNHAGVRDLVSSDDFVAASLGCGFNDMIEDLIGSSARVAALGANWSYKKHDFVFSGIALFSTVVRSDSHTQLLRANGACLHSVVKLVVNGPLLGG